MGNNTDVYNLIDNIVITIDDITTMINIEHNVVISLDNSKWIDTYENAKKTTITYMQNDNIYQSL